MQYKVDDKRVRRMIPKYWYNIVADLPVPLPPLIDPLESGESRISLLARVLPSRLIEESNILDRFIEIPEEVRSIYKSIGRPTPLVRAEGFEKALGVYGRVRIYYKLEAILPTGSHKLNTAIAQAYYARMDGAEYVVTETGAGQWGLAAAVAAARFGLKPVVFMTRSSYRSKKQRRKLMEHMGAIVYPSPSRETRTGLQNYGENHPGSLGIAIAEAVEYTLQDDRRRYLPGSALEPVLMHQTIIGQEVLGQLEEEPDYMVACVGGGSNFAGFTYPALGMKLRGEGFKDTRFIAAESTASPKLTKGRYMYDGFEPSLILPLGKMYTLGRSHVPPPLHAAGLRYHAAAPSLSLLRRLGLVEAVAYTQERVLRDALLFSKSEGILPAPESAHAVSAVIDVTRKAVRDSVVVFNLSGHGMLDLESYEVAGGGIN